MLGIVILKFDLIKAEKAKNKKFYKKSQAEEKKYVLLNMDTRLEYDVAL